MSRVITPAGLRVSLVAAVVAMFIVVGGVLIFAQQGPAPQHRMFHVQVVGDRMSPGHLQACGGDTVTITVAADRAEDIHLHGYDKHFVVLAGQPVTLTFPADRTGSFVLEIEATSTPLGTLQVQPRGGLLGLGRPADQSSTTVVKNQFAGVTQFAATSSFKLSLEIGPLQPMYTPAQVSTQHPRQGEVMFSGQMVMPPGMAGMESMEGTATMPNPAGWHHLEVHVFDRQTGQVLRNLDPSITITNAGTGQSQVVPITTMQGLLDGPGDYHYGNNVDLPSGHYTVTVQVSGETSAFDVAV